MARDALQGERGSTLARVVALGALVAAVAVVALAMFGGGDGYKVKAVFQNAGQLVKGNPVQVGGAKIGTIDEIELNNSAQAVVTLKLEDDFSPLHEGSAATIRSTSLSGIANRYVSLQPGPNSANEIEDGGEIGADESNAPVDIDTLFNTLDARTRKGLRNVIRGLGDYYDNKGPEARKATEYFSPFLVSTTDLTRQLALDQKVLERFVTDTSDTVTAIAERRDDLADLVSNTNTAFRAIGDESVALDRALELLPDTLRKANTTFVNLRATVDDLDKLVAVSKPGTKDLAPFLRELRPLVRDARPTIADLNTLIRTPGASNDLIELTAKQPRLAELTGDVFPRAIETLDRAQPVFEYARAYTPDFASWLANFGQLTANYDANGHYARVTPMFLPSTFSGGTLAANTPAQKLQNFSRSLTRCPGGITQPSADGSSPAPVGDDCDPSSTPPGG
ncbi:MAG: MCE family protein [Thermoleophilaceae bacterium]|nr:MCE family protein [Thermoleophilaceae bacterium]